MKKLILYLFLSLSFVANAQLSSVTNSPNTTNVGNDIVALYPTNNVRVPVGTAFGSINFSDYRINSVLALLADGSLQRLTVTWNSSGYSTSAGTYSVSGTITLPSGITNRNSVAASLSIDVVALETEYQTILTRATSLGYGLPTPINQGDQNALMAYLKSNGIFTQLNLFRCLATDGSIAFAKLNWVDPTLYEATEAGSPSYSILGAKGNGTSSRIDEVWIPSTNGGSLFTQNEAGFGVYISERGALYATTAPFIQGVWSNSSGRKLILRPQASFMGFNLNENGTSNATESIGLGAYHVIRTSSTSQSLSRNGESLLGASSTTTGLPTLSPSLLARKINVAATYDGYSDGRVAMSWYGASLTAKQSEMYLAMSNYMVDLQKRPYFPFTILDFFGDSMTDGGAFTSPGILNTYRNIVSKYYFPGKTMVSHAIGGTSFWKQASLANQLAADNGLTSLYLDMTGFNTAHQTGATTGGFGKCEAYIRTAFVNHAAHSFTAASSATIVSGYGTSLNCTPMGGRSTTGQLNAGGGAGTVRYTFTGPKKIAVQLIGSNGSAAAFNGAFGSCKIYIDGVLKESVNLNTGWTDDQNELTDVTTRIPVAFFYNVPASGSHTIDVVADGNGIAPIDFFAELNEPGVVCPMVFATIPYSNDGVQTTTTYNSMSDKKISFVNMINAFGYIAQIKQVNMPYYDFKTQQDADQIHPTNVGNVRMANMFMDLVTNQIYK